MRGEGIGAGDRNDIEIAFQQFRAECIAHVFSVQALGAQGVGMKNQVHLFFHLAGFAVFHQVIQATHVVVVAVGKDNGVQIGEIDAQDLGIFQEQVAEAGVEEDLLSPSST